MAAWSGTALRNFATSITKIVKPPCTSGTRCIQANTPAEKGSGEDVSVTASEAKTSRVVVDVCATRSVVNLKFVQSGK